MDNTYVVSISGFRLLERLPSHPQPSVTWKLTLCFYWQNRAYPGCTRLAEILEDLSHDSVNRFLLRERYEPKDLFNEVKPYINLTGGTLSGDDTVIDKPYSDPQLTELIGYFSPLKASSCS